MLDKELQQEIIAKGREFMKGYGEKDLYMADFESDQDMKLPMPPLVKAPMSGEDDKIMLPKDFSELKLNVNFAELVYGRKSSRRFTEEPMSLLELSFLLWSTQGIKKLRGQYATLRTVPCGGARHEFETYLTVKNIEGLTPGIYHYLPLEHAVEKIDECPDMDSKVSRLLCDQKWGAKANVVFFWSTIIYRAEWRYGIYAHRVALIDVGHIGQNLYLAATTLNLGTCGIAAFDHDYCNEIFGFDGDEEYMVYCAPVGTISPEDAEKEERATYSFVYEEKRE